MGADNVVDFPSWKDPERILQLCRVVVLTRPGFSWTGKYNKYMAKFIFISVPLIDISSRQIRRLIRQGKSIRYLVPPEVEKFIYRHKLYMNK